MKLIDDPDHRFWYPPVSCRGRARGRDPGPCRRGMRYVHLACTAYLRHLHTGDRSAPAVDAGGVLPGYAGIIVRDGYHAGYGLLTEA
jgi:hypothetical protein